MRPIIANINEKDARISRISWGGIIAGAFTIVSILFLLNLLGISLGLTVVEPSTAGPDLSEVGTGTVIWWTLSNLVAIFIGGMVASRMAGYSSNTDGGLHGFLSWSVYLVGAFIVFSSSISMLFTGLDRTPGSILYEQNDSAISEQIGQADHLLDQQLGSMYGDVKREYYRLIQSARLQDSTENATDRDNLIRSAPTQQQQNRDLSRLYPSQMYGSQNIDYYFNEPVKSGGPQRYSIDTYRGEGYFDRPLFKKNLQRNTDMTEEEIDQKLDDWEKKIQEKVVATEEKYANTYTEAKLKRDQLADMAGKSGILTFVLLILGALAGFFGGALGSPELYVNEEHRREQTERTK